MKTASVFITLALALAVHGMPGWFGKGSKHAPEYEINPNFGFRSYHQIRYEPMSVPMEEPSYGAEQGYGGDMGGDMGYGGGPDMGYSSMEPGYAPPEGPGYGPTGDGGYGMGSDMPMPPGPSY